MFGKAMADFKRSTNDFKESWEREVSFENLEKPETKKIDVSENETKSSIEKNSYSTENQIDAPEIKEISQNEFERNSFDKDGESKEENQVIKVVKKLDNESNLSDKRDWL